MDMNNINFSGKIWKVGNSFVLTVPFDFVKHGQVKEEQEYKISMKKK